MRVATSDISLVIVEDRERTRLRRVATGIDTGPEAALIEDVAAAEAERMKRHQGSRPRISFKTPSTNQSWTFSGNY